MHEVLKKLLVALLVTQNCDGFALIFKRQGIPSKSHNRFLWSQLESSGLVPVEVNVQDTVTDLATGMMQMWANAQEWYQQIQPNQPNKKPAATKPTIPEYLYEEEIPIVTNVVKKKRGQGKTNVKKKKPIMSNLPDDVQEHKGQVTSRTTVKPVKNDKNRNKSKKKKKSKKHKNITKVIDYRNYYYFFMGLLGLWPHY